MKTNEINPSDNNEVSDNSSKGLEIENTSDDKFIDGKEPNKFEKVEKEKLSKDSEVETKWENNNEQFQHFENTSNQEPYNKTEGFREEANRYAEKLREDREEQKTELNELREEQERLKKQLDGMAEERNLSASNYMNDREFCKTLDDHTAVSEEIKETQMASKVTESNIERAEELSGKERIEEEESQKENKGNLEATEREADSNSEAGEEQKYKNKFYEVEKDKLPEDFELETKWENNNEQFRYFENTSNQEPYNKTEGFREEANSYVEKLREDREEQKTKLNELREEQERLKKQLDEMAVERNLSASNCMNDKEFCQVLDDHTAVSEVIKETEMASKVTESNIERAEEFSGKERIEEAEEKKENLKATEREADSNSEAGEEQKYKNKFYEVEKDKLPEDFELETKWENNNEQFRYFENTSNQEPYNKTEGFREEANSYVEKLREDREEQKTKLNELREEQERLKKQLDEMAVERNLSASNYMNDKEFCKTLDDHTAVSEEIKETQMASKVTESNIERAEELSGKERIEDRESQKEKKEKLEVEEGKKDNNSETVEEEKHKNKVEEVEKENKFDRVEKETSLNAEKPEEMVNKMTSTIFKDMLKMPEVDNKVLQDQKIEVLEKQVLQQTTDYQKTSEKIINEYDKHVDKHKIERLIDENAEKLVGLKSLKAEIDTYRNSIYDNIIKEYGVDISSYQNDILRYKALTNLMAQMDYVLGRADTMNYTLLAEIGRNEQYIDEYSKSNIETVDKLNFETEKELQRIETNPELILEPTEVIKIENMLKRLDLFTKELLEVERQDKQLDRKILDKIMEGTGLKIEDTNNFIDLKNEQIARIEAIENRIDQISKTLRDKYQKQGISNINRNEDGTYSITYTDNKNLKKHENGDNKKMSLFNDKRQATYVMGARSEQLYEKENTGECSLLTFYRSKIIGTIQNLFKLESEGNVAELNVRQIEKSDYEGNIEKNTNYQFAVFNAEKKRTHIKDDKIVGSTKADINIGKIEANKKMDKDGSASVKATTNIAEATVKAQDGKAGFYGKGNITIGKTTIEAAINRESKLLSGIKVTSDDMNVGFEVGHGNEKMIRQEVYMNRNIVNLSGTKLIDKKVNSDTKLYTPKTGIHFSSIIGDKGKFAQSEDGEQWELLNNTTIDNLVKMKEDLKTVKEKAEKKKEKDEL